MRALEISRAATSDLTDISAYSLATFGYEVTFAYMSALDKMMDRLLDFPELGPVVPDIAQRPRCISCNRHRIFYRIEEDAIVIVRILHQKMNEAEWLE